METAIEEHGDSQASFLLGINLHFDDVNTFPTSMQDC